MKRRILGVGWLSVAIVALGVVGLPPACSQAARPNIVVILADDLGYGDLSVYGNTAYETPHLDGLAAGGLRFLDFHSSGPVCSPTRAGLVTGRYQQRAGVPGVIFAAPEQNRHHGLHTREVTFAELLQQAGYSTAVFGKWHLGYRKQFNPTHHGFGLFRGYVSGNVDYHSHVDRMGISDWWKGLELIEEPGYSTHLITKHAVRFIEQNKDGPFCLYVAHEAPHSPYQGPNDPPIRVAGKQVPEKPTPERIRRAYREMLQEMDKGVGDIVAALKRLGIERNTLVFFLSDNGGNRNGKNGPLRGFKGSVWEGGHRVPAIAWWPGQVKPGTVTEQTAISIDVMPTMLELAGVSLPKGHALDGVSLVSLLLEEKRLAQRTIFWEYTGNRAVRQGPWKLVINRARRKGKQPPLVGLYHLGKDLAEKHNLAGQQPGRVAGLRKLFAAWKQDVSKDATVQPNRPEEVR